jgi:hypothetical protein
LHSDRKTLHLGDHSQAMFALWFAGFGSRAFFVAGFDVGHTIRRLVRHVILVHFLNLTLVLALHDASRDSDLQSLTESPRLTRIFKSAIAARSNTASSIAVIFAPFRYHGAKWQTCGLFKCG